MENKPDVPYSYDKPLVSETRHSVPGRIDDNRCMGLRRKPFIVAAASFVLVCLVLGGGLVYLAGPICGCTKKSKLERRQMHDLAVALRTSVSKPAFAKFEAEHGQAAGKEFWTQAIRQRVMDTEVLHKCISLNTRTDRKPDDVYRFVDGYDPKEPWCSYTAPKLDSLKILLQRKGDDRVVLVTFNSRNWNNYPDKGVLVLWSDGDAGEWLTLDEAHDKYGITADEWADPAHKLFGKKAPFQFTYE